MTFNFSREAFCESCEAGLLHSTQFIWVVKQIVKGIGTVACVAKVMRSWASYPLVKMVVVR